MFLKLLDEEKEKGWVRREERGGEDAEEEDEEEEEAGEGEAGGGTVLIKKSKGKATGARCQGRSRSHSMWGRKKHFEVSGQRHGCRGPRWGPISYCGGHIRHFEKPGQGYGSRGSRWGPITQRRSVEAEEAEETEDEGE